MPLIDEDQARAMARALEVIQTELLHLREDLVVGESPSDWRATLLQWVNDLYVRVDLILSTTQGKN